MSIMYTRSLEIEKRLSSVVQLIRRGRYGTPELAAHLGISEPTVSRCLSALRQRGYGIRAVKEEDGWAYEIVREPGVRSNRKRRAA